MGGVFSTSILFLFGGIINTLFAGPICDAGLEALLIPDDDQLSCSCLATDTGLFSTGALTCRTMGVVDLEDGLSLIHI